LVNSFFRLQTIDGGSKTVFVKKYYCEKTIHQLKKKVIAMADCLNWATSKQSKDYFFLLLIPFIKGNRLLKNKKQIK
jgi:hypothetical protein